LSFHSGTFGRENLLRYELRLARSDVMAVRFQEVQVLGEVALPLGCTAVNCTGIRHIRYRNLHQVDFSLIHFGCTTDIVE
jgi:hypothetical protein